MIMRNRLLAVLLLCAASPAMAKDVDVECGAFCQPSFDTVAEDLVATIDFKAMGPAEATGIAGFGVGVVMTYVPVNDDWQQVTGSDFSGIGLAGLQVTKGLPFNIDLGAFYATAPDSNVDVTGAELRYAFLPGSTVAPALALRVSYAVVSGIDDIDVDATSADLSVSKGFGPFTPYAGVGFVKGAADPEPHPFLEKSEVEETKLFAGLRLGFGVFEITPQFTQIGDVASYSARLGFSFGL